MGLRLHSSINVAIAALATAFISSTPGCDAEVGDEYRGEALWTVQASVSSNLDAGNDSVLAVSFNTPDGLLLLDVETTGQFPADFLFALTEAPAESALKDGSVWGASARIALGQFVLVPRNHPRLAPKVTHYVPNNIGIDPANEPLLTKDSLCTDDEHCFDREISCTTRPCSLISSVGNTTPEQLGSAYGSIMATSAWTRDWGLSFFAFCDPNGVTGCTRQTYECDVSSMGEFDHVTTAWFPSNPADASVTINPPRVSQCELVGESGTALASEIAPYAPVRANFGVLYADADSPESKLGAIKRGYNAVAAKLSKADMQNLWNCELDGKIQAINEYNSAHGTTLSPQGYASNVTPEARTAIEQRALELDLLCNSTFQWLRVVDTSAQEKLNIEIMRAP